MVGILEKIVSKVISNDGIDLVDFTRRCNEKNIICYRNMDAVICG